MSLASETATAINSSNTYPRYSLSSQGYKSDLTFKVRTKKIDRKVGSTQARSGFSHILLLFLQIFYVLFYDVVSSSPTTPKTQPPRTSIIYVYCNLQPSTTFNKPPNHPYTGLEEGQKREDLQFYSARGASCLRTTSN